MGVPKCFEALGCFEVTFILKDFKTVTGKIVGNFDERKKFVEDKKEEKFDHKKDNKCDEHKEEKCCNVKVDIDDKCDFILVELTKDAETVLLQEVEIDGCLKIEWVNVEFPKGSCIVLNVCDIIYAGVNADIDKEKVEIRLDGLPTPPSEAHPQA